MLLRVDSAGSATKKRGIVVRSASELDEFNRILANQKLVKLARKVDLVNPKQREALPLQVPMSLKFSLASRLETGVMYERSRCLVGVPASSSYF